MVICSDLVLVSNLTDLKYSKVPTLNVILFKTHTVNWGKLQKYVNLKSL